MWSELIDNRKILEAIYGDNIPKLCNIYLHELKINFGEDIQCYLTFDIDEMPSNPPMKWILKKANTVQMDFAFGKSEIHFFEVHRGNFGDLVITFVEGLYIATFRVASKNIFVIKSKWLTVRSITGYLKE